jgi:hypothetical protein
MKSDLDLIISQGESYTVEFKESPDKVLRPIVLLSVANQLSIDRYRLLRPIEKTPLWLV